MRRNPTRGAVALLSSFLHLASVKGWLGLETEIRGAHPKSVYTNAFRCFDGSRSSALGLSRVNDNFCDCPLDGSDEPGTAACAAGRFWCKNVGGRAMFMSSSRIDDGVCDCCDGSDEPPDAQCPNTCRAEAAKAAERIRAEKVVRDGGFRARRLLA